MQSQPERGKGDFMKQTSRVLLLMASAAFLAAAQDDPPGRVGRLNYVTGEVSYRPGDVDDWVGADLNRPLTTGDHLWTDQDARAELHIGSTAVRLNSKTAFEFLNLDDNTVQIRLAEGSLNIHVRDLDDQEVFEVDTPNLAFSLQRAGDYRIDVDPDNETTIVTVRKGDGEVTGGGQDFIVHGGEQAQISGLDRLSYNVVGAPRMDDWDSWSLDRNRREDQSQSAQYVSRDMTGYQDLDDNGSWRQTPDYGAVWVPTTVEAGWAPYHNGRWVWVEPWGWTWVDDARWGFAPFHYGRWVYVGYWAWVPGPVSVRPVYAPALVAWVGGSNFNFSVSVGGGVAWFPLGPREVYVPAYHASPRYINRVNVTNTTIVNNINVTNVYNNTTYINRSAPGAITAVPRNTFANAGRVQTAAVRVDPRSIQSARVVNAAPVAPSRESVLGNSAARRVSQPPAAVQNRAVVAKRTPPPAAVPFAQRQQGLTSNPGRPLDPAQMQQLRSAQPAPPRSLVRQAPTPGNPARPGGQQMAPGGTPQRGIQNQPPARDLRQATPPAQNPAQPQNDVAPPRVAPQQPNIAPRVQRDVSPQQNNVPPPRVQRDVAPPQPNNAPRVQRDVRQPQNDVAPPRVAPQQPNIAPRVQRDVSPQQNNVPPPRVQRDVAPPQPNNVPPRVQRDTPPQRPAERTAEPARPPSREAQPPARAPERSGQREAPKPEKKDDKKDKKDKKDDKKQ